MKRYKWISWWVIWYLYKEKRGCISSSQLLILHLWKFAIKFNVVPDVICRLLQHCSVMLINFHTPDGVHFLKRSSLGSIFLKPLPGFFIFSLWMRLFSLKYYLFDSNDYIMTHKGFLLDYIKIIMSLLLDYLIFMAIINVILLSVYSSVCSILFI